MKEILRRWLNGDRDYFRGLVLFKELSSNKALVGLLMKGPSEYNVQRLNKELTDLYAQMSAPDRVINTKKEPGTAPVDISDQGTKESEIYLAAKAEADLEYKKVMNLRAELFALTRVDDISEINKPDLLEKRSKLAVEVVYQYNLVSKLYEKADFVRKNGRLPIQEPEQISPVQKYKDLPDALVKQTLDNLRKNYNKMKKREATPERVQLLTEHKEGIEILEKRWHLLKLDQRPG